MATRQPEPLIVTPTARLARAEKRRLSEALLAEGATAWHAPEVLPFSAWLGKLRSEALMAGAIDRVPVSASQARMLWQQVIDIDVFVGEPRVHALAERAWRTIHEYRLQHPRDWPEPLLSEDSRQFREWVARFEQLCEQCGVIDEWRFAAEVPELIAGHRLALPEQIELTGFELPPTPLQVAIFESLESAGVEISGLEQAASEATPEIPAMPLHQYSGFALWLLVERANGATWPFSDDRVAFPVPDSIARSYSGRLLFDPNPVRYPAATLPAAAVALAPLVPAAQMCPQVTTSGLVSEHELINPFRRNRNAVFEAHSTADLLRAPIASQRGSNIDLVLLGNPRARPVLTRPVARRCIRLARTIATLTPVTLRRSSRTLVLGKRLRTSYISRIADCLFCVA